MSRRTRRIFRYAGILLALAGVLLLFGWMQLRRAPQWYSQAALTPRQRDESAQRAEQKLIQLQNAAAQARADEVVAARNASTLPSNAIIVSFTDAEINALCEKWFLWQHVRKGYEKLMSDPRIVLKDGRLILAGRVEEFGSVASLHFYPRITEQGELLITLDRVQAGRLPLPESLMSQYQRQAGQAVQRRMVWWRRNARIDPTGVANSSAVSAVLGQLLIAILNEQPTEAVLLLPLVEKQRCIPVTLADLKVGDHKITLTVVPMNPTERAELLGRIQQSR